jgi:hypothetical protein
MPIANLPPQHSGSEIPPQQVAGKWENADVGLLTIGRGLSVDNERAFLDPEEPVRAIPDPWAQARTFGEALLDKKHTIHALVMPQWRGLLAMFALQEMAGTAYELTSRSAALSPAGTNRFSDVLRDLRPEVAIGGQAQLWEALSIFDCNGAPVAMTNPICLVSPGRSVNDLAIPQIPWMRRGIVDPLALEGADALSVTQLVVLAGWLEKLEAHLKNQGGDSIALRVAQLLADYGKEIASEIGQIADINLVVSPSIEQLHPLFDPLMMRASVTADTDPWVLSRTRIRLADGVAGEAGHFKGMILVDEAIARAQGVKPRSMFVWGHTTLSELLSNPALLADVRAKATELGWLIVTGDDLMTRRLVRLRSQNERHGPEILAHPANLRDMLLPVRPLALMTGGGALAGRLSCQLGGNRASVTLSVVLETGQDEGQRIDMTRHYAEDAGPDDYLLVTKVDWRAYYASLWPNFRSSVWDRYYLRLYYKPGAADQALPRTGLSCAHLTRQMQRQNSPQLALGSLLEINGGGLPKTKSGEYEQSVVPASGEFHDEMLFSSMPFEAITYFEGGGERSISYAGLILTPLEVKEPTSNQTSVVAIDFGTTNTVACLDRPGSRPISFQQRLLFPIRSRHPETHENALYDFRTNLPAFKPSEMRKTPTSTVAFERLPYQSHEPVSLFKNLIYFHPAQSIAEGGEDEEWLDFQRIYDSTLFGLKWSHDERKSAAASDFLEQFLTMTAAEVLAESKRNPRQIMWRYSVPDAFSPREMSRYRQHLLERVTAISTDLGEKALDEFYSEGLASAVCLLDGSNLNAKGLNMVLDIGGGTTDVTIWEAKEIRWRGSFRIAGQDFFTRLLSQNPEILHKIGLDSWGRMFAAAAEAASGKGREKEHVELAELLFSGTGTQDSDLDLQKAMDKHWTLTLAKGTGAPLRVAGLTFIAGIAWYLGRIVKQLIADGTITDPDLAKVSSFALCGRGAGLFKRIHGRLAPDDSSDFTAAVSVFSIAAGLEGASEPQLFSWQDEKLEVVHGMLVERPTIDPHVKSGARQARTEIPSGLSLTLADGTEIVPDTIITGSSFEGKVRSVDLTEFQAFVDALKAVDLIKLDLGGGKQQGVLKSIEAAVETSIVQAKQDAAGETPTYQPPFVTALKALIEELAAPADRREQRIKAELM